MTKEEARLAVKVNAEVMDIMTQLHGYAYSISWIHDKGKVPYEQLGFHDMKANCVYSGQIKNMIVTNWGVFEPWVEQELEKMKEQVKTD